MKLDFLQLLNFTNCQSALYVICSQTPKPTRRKTFLAQHIGTGKKQSNRVCLLFIQVMRDVKYINILSCFFKIRKITKTFFFQKASTDGGVACHIG